MVHEHHEYSRNGVHVVEDEYVEVELVRESDGRREIEYQRQQEE